MSDPWRYRCPKGHTDWNVITGSMHSNSKRDERYKCNSCGETFDQLIDAKTGEKVSRPN